MAKKDDNANEGPARLPKGTKVGTDGVNHPESTNRGGIYQGTDGRGKVVGGMNARKN